MVSPQFYVEQSCVRRQENSVRLQQGAQIGRISTAVLAGELWSPQCGQRLGYDCESGYEACSEVTLPILMSLEVNVGATENSLCTQLTGLCGPLGEGKSLGVVALFIPRFASQR